MSALMNPKSILAFLINWQRVRQLGRLTLLNRLALTLLVLVPLIAFGWPVVQTSSKGYNRVLSSARNQLEDLRPATIDESENLDDAESTDAASSDAKPSRLKRSALFLQERLNSFLTDVFPKPVGTPALPNAWAMAFFAALFILLGDTFLQLFCPQVVLQHSSTEYVSEQTSGYANAPARSTLETNLARLKQETETDGKILAEEELQWQQAFSNLETKLVEAQSDVQNRLDSAAPEQVSALRDEYSHLQTRLRGLRDESNQGIVSIIPRRLSIVELGSRSFYAQQSSRNSFAILLSMSAYLIAVCLILKILQEQAVNVAESAGWL